MLIENILKIVSILIILAVKGRLVNFNFGCDEMIIVVPVWDFKTIS